MNLTSTDVTRWSQLALQDATDSSATELAIIFEEDLAAAGTCDARLRDACTQANFVAKTGTWLDIVSASDDAPRVLVLGGGRRESGETHRWVALGGHLHDAMAALRLASVRLPAAPSKEPDEIESLILGALLHSYRREQQRSLPQPGFVPRRLLLDASWDASASRAKRVADSVNRARAWVEQPANLLNPQSFAQESYALEAAGVRVEILQVDALTKLGAGALLAVGRGAEHGPCLVVAEWRGDPSRSDWDAVLVGKGLTFDGGGLNLKVRPIIAKMKFDMGGAAAVLAAVELAAARKTPCNVVAIAAIAENAIDALSFRPGDVVTSMSGLTIEVADTDAEGRLVLADALTFGLQKYAPRFIVDVATLTGAVTGVLHEEFAACYASDEELAGALLEAGQGSGELLWRLPLTSTQDYLVDSDVADVVNLGAPGFLGVGVGSPTAGAKFLERFTRGARWAHLDIAGTAWSSRRTTFGPKGATGFGVRLLDRWLTGLVHKP